MNKTSTEIIAIEFVYIIISIGIITTLAPFGFKYLERKKTIKSDKMIFYLVYVVGISILALALFLVFV